VAGVSSVAANGVPNQIYLGLTSLDSSGCTAAGDNTGQDSALAMIFRSPPGAVDPVTGTTYTQEYPDGMVITTMHMKDSTAAQAARHLKVLFRLQIQRFLKLQKE
jgi:hypothetical protein